MSASRTIPEIHSYYAGRKAHRHSVQPTAPSCLELDIRPEPDPTRIVFLDGHRVDATVLEVDESADTEGWTDHELTVLRRSGKGFSVLARSTIPRATLRAATGCHTVRYDFTPHDAAKDIAIARVKASASCQAVGLDDDDVRQYAEAVIKRTGIQLKDPKLLEEATGRIVDLQRELSENAVGASRGRMESTQALVEAAAEFGRQGFHSLLMVELSCPGRVGAPARYAVRAYRADLQKLLRPRDPATGLDLRDVWKSESSSIRPDELLTSAFVGAIMPLLGLPYVRFEESRNERILQEFIQERISIYVPPEMLPPRRHANWRIRLEAQRLIPAKEYMCDPQSRASVPHSIFAASFDRHDKEVMDESAVVLAGAGSELRWVPWNPRASGMHLLRITLENTADPNVRGAKEAFSCVNVVENPNHVWLDLTYARGILTHPAADARAGSLGYGLLMGGLSRQVSQGFVFGAGLGYANAVHSASAPPSWEVGGAEYDANGTVSLHWTRQSILFGPTIAYRFPATACHLPIACTRVPRAFDLLVRGVFAFDVGVIDRAGIGANVPEFLEPAEGLDLDVSSFFQVGVETHPTPNSALYATFTLGWVGWDDFVMGGKRQTPAQRAVTYDSWVVIGGTVGAMWGL
jgi:hypothetical protein